MDPPVWSNHKALHQLYARFIPARHSARPRNQEAQYPQFHECPVIAVMRLCCRWSSHSALVQGMGWNPGLGVIPQPVAALVQILVAWGMKQTRTGGGGTRIRPYAEAFQLSHLPIPFFPPFRDSLLRAHRHACWRVNQQRTNAGDTREQFVRVRHPLGKFHPTLWNPLSGPTLTGPSRMGPPRVCFVKRPKSMRVPCVVVQTVGCKSWGDPVSICEQGGGTGALMIASPTIQGLSHPSLSPVCRKSNQKTRLLMQQRKGRGGDLGRTTHIAGLRGVYGTVQLQPGSSHVP